MKSSVVSGENRGSVNEILLKALQSGDKYGYEINKEIEIKSAGKFFLKEASLYSGLKRLEAGGFISSYWQDGDLGIRRHYYSITQKGLNKLNASNFTWDSSKEFLGEMFKNQKLEDIKTNFSNEKVNSLSNSSNVSQTENTELKKNPFQIEVSPFQQSFFDFNSENQENKNQNADNNNQIAINPEQNAINNSQNLQQEQINSNVCEEKVESQVSENENLKPNAQSFEPEQTEIEKQKENFDGNSLNIVNQKKLDNKADEVNNNLSYEKLINNYENINYTTSLQKENVIDISNLFNSKINESSIIINKSNDNKQENEENQNGKILENDNKNNDEILSNSDIKVKEQVSLENKVDENSGSDNSVANKENSLDFKNIFGSLLADENKEEKVISGQIENDETLEKKVEETVESPKPELPRINVDDDVNVMLKTEKNFYNNDYSKNQIQSRSYQDKIVQSNDNSKGVKQYINNVHKQTLISRATKITEEVNLEGINIREYSKMNNKLIRNSNYIYSNKLNFVLAIILSLLIVTESIISFVVLSKFNLLQTFEIVIFTLSLLAGLLISFIYSLKFFKDKFKVDTKKYNFKTQLFYFCLIFVVSFVLILCINIFAGMNVNNSFDFKMKIIMETLMLSNFIAYPLIKLLLYKSKYFSN